MENTLLITLDDVLHYTTVSGNLDENNIQPHIFNAQILYIEPILGSDLYNKVCSYITSGITIAEPYNTLLSTYITPSLVFHTMELFIPINAFKIADGGVFQFTPSNAQYSPLNEIEKLCSKYRIIANKYDDKLSDYLCKNANDYPEYINNTGLVGKTETTIHSGWYLGKRNITSKIRI